MDAYPTGGQQKESADSQSSVDEDADDGDTCHDHRYDEQSKNTDAWHSGSLVLVEEQANKG